MTMRILISDTAAVVRRLGIRSQFTLNCGRRDTDHVTVMWYVGTSVSTSEHRVSCEPQFSYVADLLLETRNQGY